MKTSRIALTSCLIVAITATFVMARPATRFDETTQTCRLLNSGPLDMASRSYGEGGKIFKQLCKSCHYRNNDKDAPFLWAESKTSNAWNRVFTKRYPQCAQNGEWDKLTPEQMMRVNDYLYRFSSNSRDVFDNC